MPIIGLVTFGILSTITSDTLTSGTDISLSSTTCVGNNGDKTFMGFVEENDQNVCVLLGSNGEIVYKDSNYKKLNPSPTPIEEISIVSSGSVDIRAILVLIFRIILYCSICLIPLIPILGIIWVIVRNSKKDKTASK